MMQRLSCRECKNTCCGNAGSGLTVIACKGYTNQKPQTNYDRLISKTPEELAEWIERIRMLCANDGCGQACPLVDICYSKAESPTETLDWLQQEAKEGK